MDNIQSQINNEFCLIINKKSHEASHPRTKVRGFPSFFVKYMTDEIRMAAVKQNGLAIRYIDHIHLVRNPDLIIEALKQNGLAVVRLPVDLITKEYIMMAVQQNGLVLKRLDSKYLSDDVIFEAIKNDPFAMVFLEDQYITDELKNKLNHLVDNETFDVIFNTRKSLTPFDSGIDLTKSNIYNEFIKRYHYSLHY